jgi:hypothetical protein
MTLHVLGSFLAHHQGAASVHVANGFCFSLKWSVGRPEDSSLPTDHLKEKQKQFATLALAAS